MPCSFSLSLPLPFQTHERRQKEVLLVAGAGAAALLSVSRNVNVCETESMLFLLLFLLLCCLFLRHVCVWHPGVSEIGKKDGEEKDQVPTCHGRKAPARPRIPQRKNKGERIVHQEQEHQQHKHAFARSITRSIAISFFVSLARQSFLVFGSVGSCRHVWSASFSTHPDWFAFLLLPLAPTTCSQPPAPLPPSTDKSKCNRLCVIPTPLSKQK
jgi:Ca2+/Na+ antiporter